MPPFLRDSSNQVQGFAFLSSSSADEDAQESDRIGASFFTYYFVTGLRGAAGSSGAARIFAPTPKRPNFIIVSHSWPHTNKHTFYRRTPMQTTNL